MNAAVRLGLAAALGNALSLSGPARAAAAVAVRRVDTAQPVVALTFDACPTRPSPEGFDHDIFDFLRRERIPATVFVSGQWVLAHPGEAAALAHEPLIELGNHTFSHPPLSRLSPARLQAEIGATDRLIEGLGRHSVGVRPPFGDWSPPVLEETNHQPLVLWDVVSGDAGGRIPADRIIEEVSRRTKPGSIVIFHINGRGPQTKFALPEIVHRLRARGLRFVHISELLALPDAVVVEAQAGRDTAVKHPYIPAYECD